MMRSIRIGGIEKCIRAGKRFSQGSDILDIIFVDTVA